MILYMFVFFKDLLEVWCSRVKRGDAHTNFIHCFI